MSDREMAAAVRGASPKKRKLGRAPNEHPTPDAPDRRGGASPGSRARGFRYDAKADLWGEPRPGASRLAPLPSFEDPLLRRALDIFSVPGLAHYMSVQIERQDVFVGFDALVSAWASEFGGIAFSDALADCEIDLDVVADLLRGERARADRLLKLAAGDPTRAEDA